MTPETGAAERDNECDSEFVTLFPANLTRMLIRYISRCLSRSVVVAAILALPFAAPDGASAQSDRQGFYAGLQLGVVNSTAVSSSLSGVNHPTRCDVLLYPSSVTPPVDDAACLDRTPAVIFSNEFDHSRGFAGGFIAGYRAGGVRIEMEYLHRYLGDATSPVGGADNPALQGKASEWSSDEPPYEWTGDYAAHQFFANAYYDFRNASSWTPYVGAGVGWAATGLSYYAQLVRKPAAEYLQVEFEPDWPEVAKRAAAGTASIMDTRATMTVFGYQLLAGVDYALSQRTSVGVTVRQTRFDDVRHDTPWNLVRSHAPVQADGVTPFDATMEFGGIGYQAVTVSLKYHF